MPIISVDIIILYEFSPTSFKLINCPQLLSIADICNISLSRFVRWFCFFNASNILSEISSTLLLWSSSHLYRLAIFLEVDIILSVKLCAGVIFSLRSAKSAAIPSHKLMPESQICSAFVSSNILWKIIAIGNSSVVLSTGVLSSLESSSGLCEVMDW